MYHSHEVCIIIQVQHIHIDYAKSAKRMDVKRLKSEIWKVLAVKPAQNVKVREHHMPLECCNDVVK